MLTIVENAFAIGVTGPMASGKGEVVAALEAELTERDCAVRTFILSDLIRDEARKQGLTFTREHLRFIGNTYRMAFGNGYWTQCVIKQVAESDGDVQGRRTVVIVDSIRNVGEIAALRETFSRRCTILGVDAPEEVRLQRLMARGRIDDLPCINGSTPFTALCAQELGVGEPDYGLGVALCLTQVDYLIDGTAPLHDLKAAVATICQDIWHLWEELTYAYLHDKGNGGTFAGQVANTSR